jgi:superfamily II DNA or RNA helicase
MRAYQKAGLAVVQNADDPRGILARYTLPNPKYVSALRRKAYAGNIEKTICFAEWDEQSNEVRVPLCCWRGPLENQKTLRTFGQRPHIIRHRPYQKDAVAKMVLGNNGILVAPAGSGKTVVMCGVVDWGDCATVIIVPTVDIGRQWVRRLGEHCPRIQSYFVSGNRKVLADVTILTYKLASRTDRPEVAEILAGAGMIIIDECHRAPCESIRGILARCPARYRYGCTATPTRTDGMGRALDWLLGGVVHTISREAVAENVLPVTIRRIETGREYVGYDDHTLLQSAIVEDTARMSSVIYRAGQAKRAGHKILILAWRVAQLDLILARMPGAKLVTGKTPKKEREKVIEYVDKTPGVVMLATYALAAEGLDIPSLSCLMMAAPCGNEKLIEQSCGRIARPCAGKQSPIVFDFRDGGGMVRALADKRDRVYRRLGYVGI